MGKPPKNKHDCCRGGSLLSYRLDTSSLTMAGGSWLALGENLCLTHGLLLHNMISFLHEDTHRAKMVA